MAEKEPLIVIKKITVNPEGAHGGSWKVAFADFMTAMMAFFLVMWLLSQTDDVKKNVADYFSTPSVIEYNFSNYGVELTLEKLFLDLMNEPLKFFQAFITPTDYTPNMMQMGSKKIVLHHVADQLGDIAKGVEVSGSDVTFEIPDFHLFKPGTDNPSKDFVNIMEKVRSLTTGLEDSNVFIDSQLYTESVVGNNKTKAKNVAESRLDLLSKKVEATLEHPTVDIYGRAQISHAKDYRPGMKRPNGSIKFKIKQKDHLSDGSKPRKMKQLFGKSDESMSVYDNFVHQLTNQKSE